MEEGLTCLKQGPGTADTRTVGVESAGRTGGRLRPGQGGAGVGVGIGGEIGPYRGLTPGLLRLPGQQQMATPGPLMTIQVEISDLNVRTIWGRCVGSQSYESSSRDSKVTIPLVGHS